MDILPTHNIHNKPKDNKTSIDKKHSFSNPKQPQTIKLRFRRSNKSERILEISATIPGQKLMSLIQKQFHIVKDKQLIFHNNQKIEQPSSISAHPFLFHDKDILYIYDRQFICKDTISVYVQFLNSNLIQYEDAKVVSNSNQLIISAFKDSLMEEVVDIQQFSFIHCNRYINIMQSFVKEAIEDQSLIIAIPKDSSPQQPPGKLMEIQQQFMDQLLKIPKKTSQNNNDIFQLESPDFKKKLKYRVYRAIFLPQTKQLVWKQDSNSEISKKSLIKKMNRKLNTKKHCKLEKNLDDNIISNKQNNSQNLSSNSQFSSNQKNSQEWSQKDIFEQLKNSQHKKEKQKQKFRLFQSACIKKKTQIKDLKPPKMENNLFEQIQQISFQQNCIQIENKNNLKTSAPLTSLQNSLKASIGKNRGIFIPVLTFNNININGNFQDDDDEIMDL